MDLQAVEQTIHRIHNRYGKGTIEEIVFSDTLYAAGDGRALQHVGGVVRVHVPISQSGGNTSLRRFHLHCGKAGRRYMRYAGQTRRVLTNEEYYCE